MFAAGLHLAPRQSKRRSQLGWRGVYFPAAGGITFDNNAGGGTFFRKKGEGGLFSRYEILYLGTGCS